MRIEFDKRVQLIDSKVLLKMTYEELIRPIFASFDDYVEWNK